MACCLSFQTYYEELLDHFLITLCRNQLLLDRGALVSETETEGSVALMMSVGRSELEMKWLEITTQLNSAG